MSNLEGPFADTVEKDFFAFMCGDLIGSGAHRDVYEFAPDPRFVLKFETGVPDNAALAQVGRAVLL